MPSSGDRFGQWMAMRPPPPPPSCTWLPFPPEALMAPDPVRVEQVIEMAPPAPPPP